MWPIPARQLRPPTGRASAPPQTPPTLTAIPMSNWQWLDGAGSAHGFSRGDSVDEFWYALVSPDGRNLSGSTDSDSWNDIGREVRELGHEALWFRFDRGDYLVQDPATLARTREILSPIEDLGRQQARLGRVEAELGRRQSASARSRPGSARDRRDFRSASRAWR